jgi:hypothetical protein
MAKDYDGGISTKPFEALMLGIESLHNELHRLTHAVAFEEHQSSLVDQEKVVLVPGKCAQITAARKAVDTLIGEDNTSPGFLKTLLECTAAVDPLVRKVEKLMQTYEHVITEPTGLPGHC